jgi:putative two-component system response regulator
VAHVLLVDDDQLVQASLVQMLAAGDHRATTAASVAEARERLLVGTFDLVLLDVELRGESGLDYAAELRAARPFLPVLIVSGHDDRETWTRALERGAYGFLPKPLGVATLLSSVENALLRAELERAAASTVASLEEAVGARTRQLQSALDRVRDAHSESVLLLAQAAEWRDTHTGLHLNRMSALCGGIATALGEPPVTSEFIREASLLHDVGKIAIPDAILLKPAALTAEEREVMCSHAVIGYELLKSTTSPLLQLAATIALTHHERFDGGGYPQGLVGRAIPRAGRIAAVADTYDAITSDRPYREARSPAEALAVIEAERGAQFDPDVVDAFRTLPLQARPYAAGEEGPAVAVAAS